MNETNVCNELINECYSFQAMLYKHDYDDKYADDYKWIDYLDEYH